MEKCLRILKTKKTPSVTKRSLGNGVYWSNSPIVPILVFEKQIFKPIIYYFKLNNLEKKRLNSHFESPKTTSPHISIFYQINKHLPVGIFLNNFYFSPFQIIYNFYFENDTSFIFGAIVDVLTSCVTRRVIL